MTVLDTIPASEPPAILGTQHFPQILVSESKGFSASALEHLQAFGEARLEDLDREGLIGAVRDASILWVRLRHHIDEEIFDAAPKLRLLATATTGLNHIDLQAAEQRGITVLSLRGEVEFLKNIRATAELTIGLMLALLRHIPAAAEHVLRGGWQRDLFQGRELFGKTVGVVGYGRLGRIVARCLTAFDARVLVADPNLDPSEVIPPIEPVSLARLLQESDFVTLHVNLSDQTRGFFGKHQFAQMRRGSWLINTSRGELLDAVAFADAIRSRHLSGAALDVLNNEESCTSTIHPLVALAREYSNLLITPHIGGCTLESMAKTEVFMSQRIAEAWRTRISFEAR